MGENFMVPKPYFSMDDLGGFPIMFGNTLIKFQNSLDELLQAGKVPLGNALLTFSGPVGDKS